MPFFNGTGFFVHFPPYKYIFYVTAKHCIEDSKLKELKVNLKISYTSEGTKPHDMEVSFSEYLFPHYEDTLEEEDLVICVVKKDIEMEKLKELKNRALTLENQKNIENLLLKLCKNGDNISLVGFPKEYQEINYDEKKLSLEAKSYSGKIKNNSKSRLRYGFEEATWKKEIYNGFSGSPVFTIQPFQKIGESDIKMSPIIIGVLLTATKYRGEFISINVVTDLIAKYIIKEKGL